MPPERPLSALRAVRRLLLALIVLALAVVGLQYHARLARVLAGDLHMNDFGKFYYSTRLFLEGGEMYGPSPSTLIPVGGGESRQFWNLNPPHFHLIILPFAALPERPALVAWAAANGLALIVAVALLAHALGVRWTAARVLLTTLAVAWLSPATAVTLTGQATALLLLGVVIAWRRARRGDWTGAALLLGVMASVKPFLGVFWVYLLATRRARAAGWMAAAGGVCFAAGLLAFGWAAHAGWIAAVARADWTWAAMNGSVFALFSRALDTSPYYTPVAVMPAAILPLSIVAAAFVAWQTTRALRQPADGGEADAAVAALVPASLLVAPLGWIYYLPLAAPGVLGLWQAARATRWTRLAAAAAAPGLVLPVEAVLAGRGTTFGTVTLGSIYFWSTLLVWLAVVAHLRALRRAR